jgi:hypothetical protein
MRLPDLEGGNIMWQVLIPYLHQQLVFGGFVLEPWQWFSWWPYLSAFGR